MRRPEHLGVEYIGWDELFAPADVKFVERDDHGTAGKDIIIGRQIVGSLEARPHYCDRGRWMFRCDLPDLDGADGFPRYYMDLERAKDEIVAWLNWRLWRRR